MSIVSEEELSLQTSLADVEIVLTDDDVRAFDSVITNLAHKVYNRLPPDAITTFDELIQAGQYGLFEASLKYDSSRGATFKTYAPYRIWFAMRDEVRRQARAETAPGLGDDAGYLPHLRLDAPIADGTDPSRAYHDVLAFDQHSSSASSPPSVLPPSFQATLHGYTPHDLQRALTYLPYDEWKLARDYYFGEGPTLRQLGTHAAVTEGRMSQRLETQSTFASRCRSLAVMRIVRWLDEADATFPSGPSLGAQVRDARAKYRLTAHAVCRATQINARTLRRLEREPAYVPPREVETRVVTWLNTFEDIGTSRPVGRERTPYA